MTAGGGMTPLQVEGYPEGWWHATIHLNPKSGEMHSDGDHRVRLWIEERVATQPDENPGPSTVWIPSVPLPFLGRWTDRCKCGRRFRGRSRSVAYELHYRREHERDDEQRDAKVLMEVSRIEAERIYAEVGRPAAASVSEGDDHA